jgi:hypothetical protein
MIPKFVQYGFLPTDWYKGGAKIEVLPKEREDVKGISGTSAFSSSSLFFFCLYFHFSFL